MSEIVGTYGAFPIANSLLLRSFKEEYEGIHILKLIKLVYLAHGWQLALHDVPLCTKPFVATKYGVRHRDLWDHHNKYSRSRNYIVSELFASVYERRLFFSKEICVSPPFFVPDNSESLKIIHETYEGYNIYSNSKLLNVIIRGFNPEINPYRLALLSKGYNPESENINSEIEIEICNEDIKSYFVALSSWCKEQQDLSEKKEQDLNEKEYSNSMKNQD